MLSLETLREGASRTLLGVALALSLAATACETDARSTVITGPGGGDFATVIGLDFGKTAALPAGFTAAGTGKVYVFGDEVRLIASNLTRPPTGFAYALYLARPDSARFLEIGPLTGPAPDYISLQDADTQTNAVVSERLVASAAVLKVDPAIDFTRYTAFRLVLVPKSGGTGSPTIMVAEGALPESLTATP